MNTKEVFKETIKLKYETKILKERLEKICLTNLEMMKKCPHEIVFKYNDNYPRLSVHEGTFICPACSATSNAPEHKKIADRFKYSRIIPLDNLSLRGSLDFHDAVKNEVYQNMDYYYNKDIPVEELARKMEEAIKEYEDRYDYELQRIKK